MTDSDILERIRYDLWDRKSINLNKFRKNGTYCDVKLIVDDNVYTCHRNVLASSSEFFNVMFESHFEEKNANSISLSGEVNASVFDDVLDFLYVGNVTFTRENAYEILKTSHYLQITELENECSSYIIRNTNVCYVLEIAEYFIAIKRKEEAVIIVDHIVRYIRDLRTSTTFSTISYILLHKIIKTIGTVQYNDTPMVEYVKAIFDWVAFNWNDRQYVLKELLGYVITDSTKEAIIENLCKFAIGGDNTIIVQYPRIICGTKLINTDRRTYMLEFDDNNGELVETLDICDSKLNIQATRFKNCNYYLSLDDNLYVTNTLIKRFDKFGETLLLPPPICTTNYIITTLGETMFLYDSSEKFVLREEAVDEENAIYAYNFGIDEWFSVPKVPERLFDSYLASMNGMLYLIGGRTKFHEGEIRGIVQCYDERSSKWITKNLKQDFSLNGAVCVHRDEIYIYEKRSSKTDKQCFHIYNPVADKFRSVNVANAHSTSGVLVSSPCEDKLWYFYQFDGDLHEKIYRPLREEWDEDFFTEPFSTIALGGSTLKIKNIFDGLYY